jgi:LAO/AO transport system kinase
VQPGSGDVLQFLKSGIMEIPDVLVVTKSDLGQVAVRARADLAAALHSLDSVSAVVSVSSIAPPAGIEELVDALDAHRAGLDLPARRVRSRRRHALADYAAEYGDRGLRLVGGRREAERWLGQQDGGLDVAALRQALEEKAHQS